MLKIKNLNRLINSKKNIGFLPFNNEYMIVVTGAYGFIGSCLIGFLNQKGHTDIIAVDDFSKKEKEPNLNGKNIAHRIERTHFMKWFKENGPSVSFVFHIGARTDTTEFDYSVHEKWNVKYSKDIFNICIKYSIPIIYASSAATYGAGELGYNDTPPSVSFDLKPLNPYGISKNEFDKWLLKKTRKNIHLPFWVGLKFFNVYGPNEYHKGRMASTIWHFYNQIKTRETVNLFKSHRPDFKDGEQMRDFIYIKDVLSVLYFFYENYHTASSGIYNLGTGKARTFNDLVKNVFKNMHKNENINYIDTPLDIRDTYQYFTEANMTSLKNEGYNQPFYTLEAGIEDYINGYLKASKYY
jgi:ADP-L-glycero-D-manno-heptose 6-epimerase